MKCHVDDVWRLLDQVQSFKHTATAGDRSSFFHQAAAAGRVEVSKTENGMITFHERGRWTSTNGQSVDFQNIYRWSRLEQVDSIRLEHLRYGLNNPVHLVDFISKDKDAGTLQSFQPHRCGLDNYRAILSAEHGRVFLCWMIHGPSKNDTLSCMYFIEKKGGL